MKYISFDPGKNTGVVCWNENGEPIRIEEMRQEALDEFLDTVGEETKVFIIEEYRVYSHVRHTGSKIETIQVIGQLKAAARRNNIHVVEQRANIKGIAAKWSGVKVPHGHMPDQMAALLHGYYYLHQIGIIKPRVLED